MYLQDVDEGLPDFANMTEEEQIAFAMQMSMQDHGELNIELYINSNLSDFSDHEFNHSSI